MGQTVEQALASATFYTDGQDYVFVKLPPNGITAGAGVIAEIGEPFCALLVDRDEVSLMIPADGLEDFGRRLRGYSVEPQAFYRLITIDAVLESTLIGFMARVSQTLAEAGVPVFPYAAFSRDHVFVPAPKLDAALAALERLKSASG